jgi:hypothetical protein
LLPLNHLTVPVTRSLIFENLLFPAGNTLVYGAGLATSIQQKNRPDLTDLDGLLVT